VRKLLPSFQNKKPTICRSVSLLAPRHPSDHIQVAVQRPLCYLNNILLLEPDYYQLLRGLRVADGGFIVGLTVCGSQDVLS
jgi:hypothetical protein